MFQGGAYHSVSARIFIIVVLCFIVCGINNVPPQYSLKVLSQCSHQVTVDFQGEKKGDSFYIDTTLQCTHLNVPRIKLA